MSAKTQNIKGNDPVSSKESFKSKDMVEHFIFRHYCCVDVMAKCSSTIGIKEKKSNKGRHILKIPDLDWESFYYSAS